MLQKYHRNFCIFLFPLLFLLFLIFLVCFRSLILFVLFLLKIYCLQLILYFKKFSLWLSLVLFLLLLLLAFYSYWIRLFLFNRHQGLELPSFCLFCIRLRLVFQKKFPLIIAHFHPVQAFMNNYLFLEIQFLLFLFCFDEIIRKFHQYLNLLSIC